VTAARGLGTTSSEKRPVPDPLQSRPACWWARIDEVSSVEVRSGSGAQSRANALEEELGAAATRVDVAEQHARDAENEAQQFEQDLADREAAVAAREAAVLQSVEDTISAGTFSGDGLYIVGTDIQPGTYRPEGGSYRAGSSARGRVHCGWMLTQAGLSSCPGIDVTAPSA
jgi:hypothetical protein